MPIPLSQIFDFKVRDVATNWLATVKDVMVIYFFYSF